MFTKHDVAESNYTAEVNVKQVSHHGVLLSFEALLTFLQKRSAQGRERGGRKMIGSWSLSRERRDPDRRRKVHVLHVEFLYQHCVKIRWRIIEVVSIASTQS